MLIDPKNNNLASKHLQSISDLCKQGALLTFRDTFDSGNTEQNVSLRCELTVAYGLLGYERVSLHDSVSKYGFTVTGELSIKDIPIIKTESNGPVLEETVLSLLKKLDTTISALFADLLRCFNDTTNKILIKEK